MNDRLRFYISFLYDKAITLKHFNSLTKFSQTNEDEIITEIAI
jgi:hypothetical protein